ncbi:hypothetical protein D3C85_1546320 [compost metagenome]
MKRLGQIIIGEFQALELVIDGSPGGQHQDRQIRICPLQPLAYSEAIQPRQHDIQNDQLAACRSLYSTFPALQPADGILPLPQIGGDCAPNLPVIFNIQQGNTHPASNPF